MTDRVTIILFGRVGTVHTIYSNVSRSVMMMVITILITIIMIIIVKREKPLKHLRGRTRYARLSRKGYECYKNFAPCCKRKALQRAITVTSRRRIRPSSKESKTARINLFGTRQSRLILISIFRPELLDLTRCVQKSLCQQYARY